MKDEISIDGKKYVLATKTDNNRISPVSVAKKKPVIVRTYSAGVFYGWLKSRDGKEVVLNKARRIWYWKGAASLSELAMRGTSNPSGCKFPVAVDEVILTEAIEILPLTKEALTSLESVKVWSE